MAPLGTPLARPNGRPQAKHHLLGQRGRFKWGGRRAPDRVLGAALGSGRAQIWSQFRAFWREDRVHRLEYRADRASSGS